MSNDPHTYVFRSDRSPRRPVARPEPAYQPEPPPYRPEPEYRPEPSRPVLSDAPDRLARLESAVVRLEALVAQLTDLLPMSMSGQSAWPEASVTPAEVEEPVPAPAPAPRPGELRVSLYGSSGARANAGRVRIQQSDP